MIHQSKTRCKAFTMVEMFVVIGGITLLAAILIPALSIVFSQSYRAQDASNLKNIGIQQQKWSDENKGKLPPLFFAFPEDQDGKMIVMTVPRTAEESGWDAFDERLFEGPSDTDRETVPVRQADGTIVYKTFSYGVNIDLFARNKRQHQIPNASTTVLMYTGSISGNGDKPAEGVSLNTYDNPHSYVYSAFEARHRGVANVLYMDGHVEPKLQLHEEEVYTDYGSVAFNYGGYAAPLVIGGNDTPDNPDNNNNNENPNGIENKNNPGNNANEGDSSDPGDSNQGQNSNPDIHNESNDNSIQSNDNHNPVPSEPGITVVGRVLTISGTDGPDQIQVSDDGNKWKVKAVYNDGEWEEEYWVNKSDVDSISTWAKGGDDQIQYGSTNIPTYTDGGTGDDQLQGGDGPDTMLGGPGKDQIQGNKGNDSLAGGTGNDDVKGGDGNNQEFDGEHPDHQSTDGENPDPDSNNNHDINSGDNNNGNADNDHAGVLVNDLPKSISHVIYIMDDGTRVKVKNYGSTSSSSEPGQNIAAVEKATGKSVSTYTIKAGTKHYDADGNQISKQSAKGDVKLNHSDLN